MAAIANEEAQVLAPIAGWLLLTCAFLLAMLLVVHREGWRRLWLRAEDPRTMGLFRIAFGLCVMGNVAGWWGLYTYLFTDEGLFLTDVARHVVAPRQFEGFGNGLGGDPYGFLDASAVARFLAGPKYSLLFFWDAPWAFWTHWVAFQVALGATIVGWKTNYSKWIAWFLFHSLVTRNGVFWETTEILQRVFFFYLCLSRCGAAYSVDNWLRCRALRRAGRLSERGLPGNGAGAPVSDAHPRGLEAVYRLIPAWPRMLLVLQCGAVYCAAGMAQHGPAWWSGDALYEVLHLEHLYRFPPHPVSAWFSTNLMRIGTVLVHAWECAFPIVIFGLLVRFGLREHLPRKRILERAIAMACWIGLGFTALALCLWLQSRPHDAATWVWTPMRRVVVSVWMTGMALLGWISWRLRHRPFVLRFRKRRIRIDRPTLLTWGMGRRVWLFLGVIVHLHAIVLTTAGWLHPTALAGFLAFANGGEIAVALAMIGRWLGRLRVPWIPAAILRGLPPLPAEDPRLPHLHHDGVRLPTAAIVVAIVATTAGVVLHGIGALRIHGTLVVVAAFLVGAMVVAHVWTAPERRTRIVPRPFSATTPLEATAPWAYGPAGRFLVHGLVIYHLVGVACWLLPETPAFAWRTEAQAPFRRWLETTQTTQRWDMFAPEPPRENRLLRVLVTDRDGVTWDMKVDEDTPKNVFLPMPSAHRQRRIHHRLAGGEGNEYAWYQKWHARWYCRNWALEHEGQLPLAVELVAISYAIPDPAWVHAHGPYDPLERRREYGQQRSLYRAECLTEPDGQLPARLRARHDLGPSPVPVRRWRALGHRAQAWEQARRAGAGEEEAG